MSSNVAHPLGLSVGQSILPVQLHGIDVTTGKLGGFSGALDLGLIQISEGWPVAFAS